jgi:hypothetical protein
MRLDLLSHEARLAVLWELNWCSGRCSTDDDDGEVWCIRGAMWVVLSIQLSTIHVLYLRTSIYHFLSYCLAHGGEVTLPSSNLHQGDPPQFLSVAL